MVENVPGAPVGAAIDREDGDSCVKGAIGYLAEGAVKGIAPLRSLSRSDIECSSSPDMRCVA